MVLRDSPFFGSCAVVPLRDRKTEQLMTKRLFVPPLPSPGTPYDTGWGTPHPSPATAHGDRFRLYLRKRQAADAPDRGDRPTAPARAYEGPATDRAPLPTV
jgi:hypothetical protein